MGVGGYITGGLGVLAAGASILAYLAAMKYKSSERQNRIWLALFWYTVGAYMTFFAVGRITAELGLGDTGLTILFYLQTVAGAATIVSLSAIVLQVFLRPFSSGFASGLFMALAGLAVFLVIEPGAMGPLHSFWTTTFLPHSIAARVLIGVVYMVVPTIFAIMIYRAIQHTDPITKHRFGLFGLGVWLMYLPNAVLYVTLMPDVLHVILAAIMAAGAVIGWRSYLPPKPDESSSNGGPKVMQNRPNPPR